MFTGHSYNAKHRNNTTLTVKKLRPKNKKQGKEDDDISPLITEDIKPAKSQNRPEQGVLLREGYAKSYANSIKMKWFKSRIIRQYLLVT